MTLPSEKCGPIVIELLALYDELESVRYRPNNIRAGHLAHGWYMRVRRGVEAVLELEQAGLAGEAAPIRRSIIEHVIALKWLAAEGGSIVETIKRGHKHGIEKLRASLIAANWKSVDVDSFATILAELEDADPSRDNMLHFTNRARMYGVPDDIPQYYSETALGHPSYESAIAFWELPAMTPLQFAPSVSQMGFCMGWLLTATLVFQDIFEPSLWPDQLINLTARARAIDIDYRLENGMEIPAHYY